MIPFVLLAVSVLAHGADCSGAADSTAAIQAAVDATPAGDSTTFGDACTFKVNGALGVHLHSDMTLALGNSTINVANTGLRMKAFETTPGAANVFVTGGTLVGSRTPFTGLQWGIGLRVDGATNVKVTGTVFRDWWFDGIWVGGNTPSTDVVISGVSVSNSRRNGLSIVNAARVAVEDSSFNGSNGQSPESGIDVEPNPGERVTDLVIRHCQANNNVQVGFYTQRGRGTVGDNYRLISNVARGSGKYGIIMNDTQNVAAFDNVVDGAPICASAGVGVTLVFSGNTLLNCARPLILAGVREPRVVGNKLDHIEPVTITGFPGGVVGNVVLLDNRP